MRDWFDGPESEWHNEIVRKWSAAGVRMEIDGFVFNCKGPIPPVAFQQAAASIILEG